MIMDLILGKSLLPLRKSAGWLQRLEPLPPYTAVVGMGDDGLPLLLDLSDPAPGAILIRGYDERGTARLLQVILASACALNPPQRVRFCLITPDPKAFRPLSALPHCCGVFSPYERQAAETIIELAQRADERRSGKNLGAAWVLAIEPLNTLVQYQGYEVLSHLRWLVQFGPQSGIRPVASGWGVGEPRLLSSFRTHINQVQANLFVTRLGGAQVRFWLPEQVCGASW
jgi:hypothetical protein